MSDFDYGNARLRAMKSRLLSRRTLDGLVEAGSLQGLLTALTDTAYREAVQAALVRLKGLDCLAEALRNDLVATLGQARKFFRLGSSAHELAAVVLRRYDVHNVKTVLRGVARQVPADEILAATLPIGDLRPADLAELARAADARAVIDLLATWRVPLAQPLHGLRAPRPDLELFEMELALDRWHLRTAMQAAREAREAGGSLAEALRLEADVTNLLTALRVAGAAEAAAVVRARFGSNGVAALFVDPGYVSLTLLAQAAQKVSVPAAVEALSSTRYGTTLAGALEDYAARPRLSLFERALARRTLRHAADWFIRDPLGIGILLGYVALKTNEIANLRAMAQGLLLGEKADRIRAALMFIE